MEGVRIDKWLWSARFLKTRSAATDVVAAGRVHVNDEPVKPSRRIAIGDTVEVRVGQSRWTVIVRGISDKRGAAAIASTLYDELPESVAERERQSLQRRLAPTPGADLGARPTKRDRRRLERLRREGA